MKQPKGGLRQRALGIGLALLMIPAPAGAGAQGDRWFCTITEATGFVYRSSQRAWVRTHFQTDNMKYVLRPPRAEDRSGVSDIEGVRLVIDGHGGMPGLGFCRGEPDSAGFQICRGAFDTFLVNFKQRRFQVFGHGGYAEQAFYQLGDEKTDRPVVGIGHCSPL